MITNSLAMEMVQEAEKIGNRCGFKSGNSYHIDEYGNPVRNLGVPLYRAIEEFAANHNATSNTQEFGEPGSKDFFIHHRNPVTIPGFGHVNMRDYPYDKE